MLRPRIIPCLLLKNGGLVKTVQFGASKYVGDPINAVKIFNEKEAEELLVIDIDASVHGREPNFRLLAQIAVESRMPLCYGGGIRTVDHASRIIGLGVEKVALSSALIADPSLAAAIACEIGKQSVVFVLDVKRRANGSYEVCTHNGHRRTGKSPIDLAHQAEEIGVGEVLINSIDNDGVMHGYDLALAQAVRRATPLPLTVLGGAGSLEHIARLVAMCGVIGAAAGSLFVFKGPYKAVLINYPNEAEKKAVVAAALHEAPIRVAADLRV